MSRLLAALALLLLLVMPFALAFGQQPLSAPQEISLMCGPSVDLRGVLERDGFQLAINTEGTATGLTIWVRPFEGSWVALQHSAERPMQACIVGDGHAVNYHGPSDG